MSFPQMAVAASCPSFFDSVFGFSSIIDHKFLAAHNKWQRHVSKFKRCLKGDLKAIPAIYKKYVLEKPLKEIKALIEIEVSAFEKHSFLKFQFQASFNSEFRNARIA